MLLPAHPKCQALSRRSIKQYPCRLRPVSKDFMSPPACKSLSKCSLPLPARPSAELQLITHCRHTTLGPEDPLKNLYAKKAMQKTCKQIN